MTQRETESATSSASSVRRKICRASSFPSIEAPTCRESAGLDYFGVQHIWRQLSLEKRDNILRGDQRHLATRFIRSGTQMRREDHVGPFQSGMNKGLLFKNIQSRAGNFPRFQGMHQGSLIHYWSARSIDQKCRRLHAKQFRRVKHLPGVAIERYVQGDKIGFSK